MYTSAVSTLVRDGGVALPAPSLAWSPPVTPFGVVTHHDHHRALSPIFRRMRHAGSDPWSNAIDNIYKKRRKLFERHQARWDGGGRERERWRDGGLEDGALQLVMVSLGYLSN